MHIFILIMEIGQKITVTRKTFKYGNSVGIVIPAQLGIPPGTVLTLTIERPDLNKSD